MQNTKSAPLCSPRSNVRMIGLANEELAPSGLGNIGRTVGSFVKKAKCGVSALRIQSFVWPTLTQIAECPLPSLSTLLENQRIKETDSFVICVQMHSPVGPFFPQQPSAYYVPRDLLEGLEASLDNASRSLFFLASII